MSVSTSRTIESRTTNGVLFFLNSKQIPSLEAFIIIDVCLFHNIFF